MSAFLDGMDDTNSQNHAYTKGKSCITAILDVQRKLPEARLNWDRNLGSPKPNGKKILQFISADDIASAFESIGHVSVSEAVRRSFFCHPGINLHGLLKDYLSRRKSYAVDRNGGDNIEITKVFEDKTAPQGSLLSPKLWRIYDSLFSDFYEEGLRRLVEKCGYIKQIDHLSYADDHLTLITIVVDEDLDPYTEANLIKTTLDATRELLFEATTRIGCSINPGKSEGIVDPQCLKNIAKFFPELVKKDEEKIKNSFKWLVYILRLVGCELIFSEAFTKKALMSSMSVVNQLFQFTTNAAVRWKAFKTYVVPIIEMFLIFQAQKGLNIRTVLHKIQHRSLSKVVNLTHRNSEEKLLRAIDEMSISDKVVRMAKRVAPFMQDTFGFITSKLENETRRDPNSLRSRPRTRSGRVMQSGPETPTTKLIKGHIIFKLMELQAGEVPKIPKTDLSKAAMYAERARKTASRHIMERARKNQSKRQTEQGIQNPIAEIESQNDTENQVNRPGRFYI